MRPESRRSLVWLAGWLATLLLGALNIVRVDIAQRRDAFQAEARLAHAILSQRAAQNEAIVTTLALLRPENRAEQHLSAVHPQVLAVLRVDAGDVLPEPALQAAEERSRQAKRAVLGAIDAASGPYALVLAGEPGSYALRIDVRRMVASDGWPLQRDGPIRVTLAHAGSTIVLQPGAVPAAQPAGLTAGFVFEKPLSVASQPFVLRLSRATGPAE